MTERRLNISGRELEELLVSADMSPPGFCALADISIPTYYRLVNEELVKGKTAHKAELAIQNLRERLRLPRQEEGPDPPHAA